MRMVVLTKSSERWFGGCRCHSTTSELTVDFGSSGYSSLVCEEGNLVNVIDEMRLDEEKLLNSLLVSSLDFQGLYSQ